MKMSITKMMLFSILVTTTLMILSSNNLLFMWMNLELNMISLIPLMTKSKKMNDQTMKYFIIQETASSLIIISIIINSIIEAPLNESNLMMTSMLMKLGMMPMHIWLPNLMLSLSWQMCMLMSTLQKINPSLMTSQTTNLKSMMIPMIITLVMSPITGMNQTSSKKMMAYSSISNLPWMVYSIKISKSLFMVFMITYSIMTILIFKKMKKFKMNFLNQTKYTKKMDKFSIIIMLLSITGMPPLIGFFPKWMILQKMILLSPMMSFIMILSSTLSMYMYMNFTTNSILMFQMTKMKKTLNFNSIILMMNFLGIPMTLLTKST